jgi:hypothetical protein
MWYISSMMSRATMRPVLPGDALFFRPKSFHPHRFFELIEMSGFVTVC